MVLDGPILNTEDGTRIRCRVLIGADGDRSLVSKALGLPPTEYAGICGIRYTIVLKSCLI